MMMKSPVTIGDARVVAPREAMSAMSSSGSQTVCRAAITQPTFSVCRDAMTAISAPDHTMIRMTFTVARSVETVNRTSRYTTMSLHAGSTAAYSIGTGGTPRISNDASGHTVEKNAKTARARSALVMIDRPARALAQPQVAADHRPEQHEGEDRLVRPDQRDQVVAVDPGDDRQRREVDVRGDDRPVGAQQEHGERADGAEDAPPDDRLDRRRDADGRERRDGRAGEELPRQRRLPGVGRRRVRGGPLQLGGGHARPIDGRGASSHITPAYPATATRPTGTMSPSAPKRPGSICSSSHRPASATASSTSDPASSTPR